MEFQVFRTHASDYLGKNFIEKEKESLGLLKKVQYLDDHTQIDPNSPLVLLGSSQSIYEEYSTNTYKQIKLVIHANSGFDNISLPWCESLSAPIIIGHGIRQNAVSEYVLSVLFSHYTNIPISSGWDRSWERDLLSNQKILIVGFGHIGKTIYQCLFPLNQQISIYDPFKGRDTKLEQKFDIIINCASLNLTSQKMINKSFLEHLCSDGVFVNPARGKIVNEEDLCDFLRENPKSHAYLDVFFEEPADFTKFSHLKNLTPSSHLAGVYKNISNEVLEFEKTVIKDFTSSDSEKFTQKYEKEILQNRILTENKKKFFI
jgi:D-3-phosphoglycerate dehydrogenase